MSKHSNTGAMLIEVLILAPVISALATVSILSVQQLSREEELLKVASEITTFATGLELYALDHGHYPSARLQGASKGTWKEYQAYLDPDAWLHSAPLGGRYDWQDAEAGHPAGICIRQSTASIESLTRLDEKLDDGSLHSGRFHYTAGGTRLIYTLNAPQ